MEGTHKRTKATGRLRRLSRTGAGRRGGSSGRPRRPLGKGAVVSSESHPTIKRYHKLKCSNKLICAPTGSSTLQSSSGTLALKGHSKLTRCIGAPQLGGGAPLAAYGGANKELKRCTGWQHGILKCTFVIHSYPWAASTACFTSCFVSAACSTKV